MEGHASEVEHAEASINCKPLRSDALVGFDGGDSEGDSGQAGCLKLALEDVEASQQVLTTVVVRNIPRHFQVPDLLSEMQLVGFVNFITLVNLPQDRKKALNRGYAFVNFQTPDAAFCFLKALNGHQWHDSTDTAMADWAIVQGHEATAALAQVPPPKRGGWKWHQRRRRGRMHEKKVKEFEDDGKYNVPIK
jgi:hypothetical protein